MVSPPAAWVAPGNLLEMQILGACPQPFRTLGRGWQSVHFDSGVESDAGYKYPRFRMFPRTSPLTFENNGVGKLNCSFSEIAMPSGLNPDLEGQLNQLQKGQPSRILEPSLTSQVAQW